MRLLAGKDPISVHLWPIPVLCTYGRSVLCAPVQLWPIPVLCACGRFRCFALMADRCSICCSCALHKPFQNSSQEMCTRHGWLLLMRMLMQIMVMPSGAGGTASDQSTMQGYVWLPAGL